MDDQLIPLTDFEELSDATAGHDILRYVSIPGFLGQEKNAILYFIGRNLARQINITKNEDLFYLFEKFRWGTLDLVKDRRRTLTFHLMSDDVAKRLLSPLKTDYRLEAGFIAEAIEKIYGRKCECTETINERLYRVQFKVTFTHD